MLFAGFTRVVRYAVLYTLFSLCCVVACVCAAARGDPAPRAVYPARVQTTVQYRYRYSAHMLAAGFSLGGKTTIANVYKSWRKGL